MNLTTERSDDAELNYFVEAGVTAVRRVLGHDIDRIVKAAGVIVQASIADLSGEESFDLSLLGCAEQVYEE